MSEMNQPNMLETPSMNEKHSEDAMLFLFKSHLLQCGLHTSRPQKYWLRLFTGWIRKSACLRSIPWDAYTICLQMIGLFYLWLIDFKCSFSMMVFKTVQFSSVTQSCPTLCDPMNSSTPGLPVHHQLPEFTQTHVHRLSDAIPPSHPQSSPSRPAPNPSQHQSLFQWVNSSHEVAKVLEFPL